MSEQKQTQSYFSALARGGLVAAIHYTNQAHKSQERSSPNQSYNNRSPYQESENYTNTNRSSKTSIFNTSLSGMSSLTKPQEYSLNQQTHYQTHKRLQSLMNGNDLQPLEEEVSKEEDDSMIIKVEVHQQPQYTSGSQLTFGFERPPLDKQVSEPKIQGRNSHTNKGHAQSQANIQSCSSLMSGEYDYTNQMEEATFEMIKVYDDSNVPKIFDPQFQQSYERSENLPTQGTGQSNYQNTTLHQSEAYQEDPKDAFNQQQKDKAKMIIESLKAHASKSPIRSGVPVEKRLFDYQKKLEEKLEAQRKLKEDFEQQQLRPVPQITEKSNEILMRRSIMIHGISNNGIVQTLSPTMNSDENSPNRGQLNMFSLDKLASYQVEGKAYYEELQRREDLRRKILEDKEMQGFTGKPEINKKSKSMKRKVEDLLTWKEQQEKKREEEFQKKKILEFKQIQDMQSHRVMSKQSEKLIEHKTALNEKVEERLQRDAKIRQKRQQTSNSKNQVLHFSSKKPGLQRVRSRSQKSHSKSKSPIQRTFQQTLNQDLHFDVSKPFAHSSDQHTNHNSISTAFSQTQKQQSPMSRKLKQSLMSPPYNNHKTVTSPSQQYDMMNQQYYQQQQLQQQMMMHQQVPNSFVFNQFQNPLYNSAVIPSQQYQHSLMTLQQTQRPSLPVSQQISFNDHSLKQNQSYQSQPSNFNRTQPINTQLMFQNEAKPKQASKVNVKKAGGKYESLFDKLQRMNTSNQSQESQESSTSMPIVSAQVPQLFSGTPTAGGTPQMNGFYNPIYQSIQIESQRLSNFSPLLQQPINQIPSQPLLEQNYHPQYTTYDPYAQNFDHFYQQQYMNQVNTQSFNRNNQGNQDVIIHKILDSSFIPSGNINQKRRQSLKMLNTGGTGGDPEELQSDLLEYDQCVLLSNKQYYQTNHPDKHDQGVILDTEQMSNQSDSNVVRNLNPVLNIQDCNRTNRSSSPINGKDRMDGGTMNFMDRNNIWLENKKNKIQKAKEIHDQRQERECPFKPQIKINKSNNSKSRHSKSRENSLEESQRSRFKNLKTVDKENLPHQILVTDNSQIEKYVNSTSLVHKSFDTSKPLSEQSKYQMRDPLSSKSEIVVENMENCSDCEGDISQDFNSGVPMIEVEESGFCESFISMDANEFTTSTNKQKMQGVTKQLNTKFMQF